MINHDFRPSWSVNWEPYFQSVGKDIQKQLIGLIADEYRLGNYPDDFMMPSVRNLSAFLGVKRYLVERAYMHWIKREEILYAQARVGTFMYAPSVEFQVVTVASHAQFSFNQESANPSNIQERKLINILTLGSTYPVQSVNVMDLRGKNKPGKTALTKEVSWLFKDALKVLRKRKLINNELQFCNVPDGKAVFKVLKTITIPGDLLVATSRNDSSLLETAKQLQLNIAFSGSDRHGMSVMELEKICLQKQVKVVVVRPEPDFPIPFRMDVARWNHIVSLSERFGFCILVLDEDYEFRCTKSPSLPISLKGGNVIYISPYSKVYPILHKTSMVAGPEDFIATLIKKTKKINIAWNHSTEKALMASLSRSELKFQLKKSNQCCTQAAFNLKLIVDNYLGELASMIYPRCGTFAFLAFKRPLSGSLATTFMEHALFHEEENLAFEPNEPIDALRVSLYITDWVSIEFSIKIIRDILDGKSGEVFG